MCQTQTVAMKKRSRNGTTVETVTKRAKQIVLDEVIVSKQPTSPVDVAADFDDAGVTSESSVDLADFESCNTLVSQDLNLEVKLMQGAVNDMQTTVNLASTRISELRELLLQYAAESR